MQKHKKTVKLKTPRQFRSPKKAWVDDEARRLSLFIKSLCNVWNTPASSLVSTAITSRDLKAYKAAEPDPRDYIGQEDNFRRDLFLTEILRKSTNFFTTDIDPAQVGLEKFIKTERHCASKNLDLWFGVGQTPDVEALNVLAKQKISEILGFVPEMHSLDDLRWGKGATLSITRAEALRIKKLGELPIRCTRASWKYLSNYLSKYQTHLKRLTNLEISGDTCLLEEFFEFDEVAELKAVPKKTEESRIITLESTGIALLSRTLGFHIRRRLARFGIDLWDQDINKTRAREALRLGLATVDLSAASDSISLVLIHQLLPKYWSELVLSLRTPRYHNPLTGNTAAFEKFAGQGNGITFPLEALIFYATAYAVCIYNGVEPDITVYGDDIILPGCVVKQLDEYYNYLGFTVNINKSHYKTLFRESCGGQYFDGHDVTPIYIKEVALNYDTCRRNYNRIFRYFVSNNEDYPVFKLLGIIRNGYDHKALYPIYLDDIPETDDHFYLLYGDRSDVFIKKEYDSYVFNDYQFLLNKLLDMEDWPVFCRHTQNNVFCLLDRADLLDQAVEEYAFFTPEELEINPNNFDRVKVFKRTN